MGCLFACFRVKDSSPPSTVEADRVVRRNQLAALLLSEVPRSLCLSYFLESCQSQSQLFSLSFMSFCYRSLIMNYLEDVKPDTFFKKFNRLERPDQVSNAPPTANDCLAGNKCGNIPRENRRLSLLTKLSEEGRKVESIVDSASKDFSSQTGGQIHGLASQNSPGPAPLRLAKEMDTPGTLSQEKVENGRLDANALTQTQHFCLVRNPLLLRVSSHNSCQSADSANAGTGQQGAPSFVLVESEFSQMNDKASSSDRVSEEAGSKPIMNCSDDPFASPDGRRLNNGAALKERFPNSKSPVDRPIIGMVAAHWNDDETTGISPKLWDGNGIPNSTNKYKEDQKVSWHATPFEERLEKALSDEKLYPQRKLPNGKPIKFDEREENDAAAAT
ncbi:unnamed protein product [Spirodela intermedia]|uniref:Uncharacterized protein n=1 Tax=Spirodela intermedia TaxID=51605 RepID=A0A7I8JJW4_SPIIN|nr:unnamed protein product [Spirodela intermedia]CAA6669883.1 unnamed protein product [Spirodela intermedia]